MRYLATVPARCLKAHTPALSGVEPQQGSSGANAPNNNIAACRQQRGIGIKRLTGSVCNAEKRESLIVGACFPPDFGSPLEDAIATAGRVTARRPRQCPSEYRPLGGWQRAAAEHGSEPHRQAEKEQDSHTAARAPRCTEQADAPEWPATVRAWGRVPLRSWSQD